MFEICKRKEEKMIEILDIKDAEPNKSNWIPISDMPNCCGYPVLLTVENKFGQREVCKAFTNYMKEGKQLFYTHEKEFCAELTSSRLSDLKNVDLPQPEGPIMAITSPLVIVVLMSLSTTWSPNVFLRFFTSRITLVSFIAS